MTLWIVRLVALFGPLLLAVGCDVEERTPVTAEVDARPPLADASPRASEWGALTVGPVVLSAWGPSPNELFFVGGSPVTGGFIGRLDGDRIVAEILPAGPALWWVWGADRDHVRAAGEGGRILRRTGSGWVAEETGLSARAQLWGGFSTSPDDHWAVGGAVRRGGEKGIVLRKQGGGPWTRVEDPAFPTESNLFKVWGAAPDDLHIVGEGGVALHWDGRTFRRVPTPDAELLFTVHGLPGGLILAVGGVTAGRVLRYENEAWVDDPLPAVPALNGVFVRSDGTALVSGTNGTLLLRATDGTYSSLSRAELQPYTLHAVFSGRDDWAVGGDLARGDVGVIATNRTPIPVDDFKALPDADASVSDATSGHFDARLSTDAGPPADAQVRSDSMSAPDAPVAADSSRGDALGPRDFGEPVELGPSADAHLNTDARFTEDAVPARDAARDQGLPPPPDMAPPPRDLAPPAPDLAPPGPDMAPPLPGPGQPCADADYLCSGDIDCFSVMTANGFSEPLCLQPCAGPADCDPAYGPAPCCAAPGPQLLMHYCYSAALVPEGCP